MSNEKQIPDSPLSTLVEEAVYLEEAVGQLSLTNNETLPTKIGQWCDGIRWGCLGNEKAILEAAGIKFFGEVEGDPEFQRVELPTGWKIVPTEHPMNSYLLDNKGRRRAEVFYKAAFYDRWAQLTLLTRFSYIQDIDRLYKGMMIYNVLDSGKVIHSTRPIRFPQETDPIKPKRGFALLKAGTAVKRWLQKNYPDWQKLDAYWD